MKNIVITTIFSIFMIMFIIVLIKKEILIAIADFLKKIPKFIKIIFYIAIIAGLIYLIRI